MAQLNLAAMTPMQLGRINAVLDKQARYQGEVRTLRDHIATLSGKKTEGDGFIDYNRRRFNSMTGQEQRAYEARLKARRYFYIDGWQVPKIVFDAVEPGPKT
ncbi:hypothetical protein UFOVP1166_7 [uncultured Caudovirales phage]|uniref:Uncharacterized protein n=1 Tax=uncultured Caudovirales phage TaxID=2100421 RepID=A0A6J5QZ60_9CAUD|nr:hypothetical protein UFOVP1166_7 [uncultured Caudovirales phage]